MHFNNIKRPLAASIAAIFLLSACATNPDGSFKMDEKATGALIGAAAGCAIGAAAKGAQGCVVGAAVGAAAGYLVGWYFESKKLADAQQVNNDYERQIKTGGKGKVERPPKNDVIPAKFETKVNSAPPDNSGQKEIHVTSNTDLVGYGDKVPVVEQKYAIYDEKNNLVEEKTEKVTAVDGAGRYQTNSKFKLPAEAKGKKYTVKTTLVADNKTYKENAYKVTALDGQTLLVAALY